MARRLTRDNVSARVAAVCYLRIVDPMRAIIGPSPGALQLRYLQTRGEVGAEPGSTIVLPLPKGTIKPFSRATGTASAAKSCSGVLGASSVPPHSGARAVRGGSDHARGRDRARPPRPARGCDAGRGAASESQAPWRSRCCWPPVPRWLPTTRAGGTRHFRPSWPCWCWRQS